MGCNYGDRSAICLNSAKFGMAPLMECTCRALSVDSVAVFADGNLCYRHRRARWLFSVISGGVLKTNDAVNQTANTLTFYCPERRAR